MIDARAHVVPSRLPGVSEFPFRKEAELVARLRDEMTICDIDQVLAIGSWSNVASDPLGIEASLKVAQQVSGLQVIAVANPRWTKSDQLSRIRDLLASQQVRGLMIYLGYLPVGPEEESYRRYYELAEQLSLPVIFHVGRARSPVSKLKLSHPLQVDAVAVDYPAVNFVLSQFGAPWMTDAAEVISKNVNVWADLSGLLLDDRPGLEKNERRQDVMQELRRAFRAAGRPNRFLYGSQWPGVSMQEYQQFIQEALPSDFHSLIFEENARRLFRLEK